MAQKITPFQKFALGFSGILFLAVVVMIIAFGDKGVDAPPDPAREAEIAEIKVQRLAREYVLGALADPDSAQFRNQNGLCGEVNAKNKMGGYAGYTRFIAASKEVVIIEGDGFSPQDFERFWREGCTQ